MDIDSYKIRVILAETGISQAELAVKCGVARQNISTILAKGRCSPRTAGKLAAGLGVHVREIAREATYGA